MKNIDTLVFPMLYAAPISYYGLWLSQKGNVDKFENFQKQTFRNRCRVFGANGVISLSIPVTLTQPKTVITEVQISNQESWQRNHWRTLVSAYKSSPFFEFYAHLIEPLYLKKYDSLWEFNLNFHYAVLSCLQLDTHTHFTTEFNDRIDKDPRKVFSSKKSHLKANSFPVYQQVFSYDQPFETDLSILDAIFNLGPETENYLRSFSL